MPKKYAEFHIVLFDLTWLNDGLIQKMRVDVLSSVNVKFYDEDNTEVWEKIGDDKTKYFLKNINFGTAIFNENQSNYGDENKGSKYDDSGLIIQNALFNYGGNVVKNDGKTPLNDFDAEHVFGALPITEYGNIIYKIDFTSKVNAYKSSIEKIELNNEKLIIAGSRSDQILNKEFKTFTRASYIKPSEELFIGQGGYAEYAVMLNDTGESSRIVQQISFDIVSVDGDKITSYNSQELYVVNEKSVFEENSYTLSDIYHSDDRIPVHILPRGRQLIKIIPQKKGTYTFTLTEQYKNDLLDFDMSLYDPYNQVEVSKNNGAYSADLIAGREYMWVISNNGSKLCTNKIAMFTFTPPSLNVNKQEQFDISHGGTYSYSIISDEAVNYHIEINIPYNVRMVFWSQSDEIETTYDNSGTYELICQGNVRYFVTFYNYAVGSVECSVKLTEGDKIILNAEKRVSLKPYEYTYLLFTGPIKSGYSITSDNENCEVEILNGKGEVIDRDPITKTFYLIQERYFIRVKNNNSSASEEFDLKISINLPEVKCGINNLYSARWMMFVPESSQRYNLSTVKGNMTIYDSHFQPIASDFYNESMILHEGEIYYIYFSYDKGNEELTISVDHKEI